MNGPLESHQKLLTAKNPKTAYFTFFTKPMNFHDAKNVSFVSDPFFMNRTILYVDWFSSEPVKILGMSYVEKILQLALKFVF